MIKRHSAILLSLVFLFACGDDDRSTGPEESPLVGTWTVQEGEEEGTFTFEDDGTLTLKIGTSSVSVVITGTWSAVGNRLTLGILGGVYSYEIRGGELTFTAVETGGSALDDYTFETDGDPAGVLTGVRWVDEDGDELEFYADGTYRWGDGFEKGTWTAEGRTITVYETSQFSYVVSGNTLTLTDSDGEEIVLTKE